MKIRRYRPADRGAVIALFRAFMQELTPPHLEREFAAQVVGAGVKRYHYEKAL